MPERKFQRVVRTETAEERERHAAIRQAIMQEFPPAEDGERRESPPASPPRFTKRGKREA